MPRSRTLGAAAIIAAVVAAALAALPIANAETGDSNSAGAPETTAIPFAGPAGSPVDVNGQLSVCGVNLCNQAGEPIQLHPEPPARRVTVAAVRDQGVPQVALTT